MSTATTCLPAPTAYRSSVAVGDSETIRVGWALIVTVPPGVVMVSGNFAWAELAAAVAGWLLLLPLLLLVDELQAVSAVSAATARSTAHARGRLPTPKGLFTGSSSRLRAGRRGRRHAWQ